MTSRSDFWKKVDEHRAPGVLLVTLLTSWKPIADAIGRDALDIASGLFDVLTEAAFSPLAPTARLSTTVAGGYSTQPDQGEAAMARLDRWLPLTITAHQLSIPIDISHLAIARTAGLSGEEVYGEAQRQLDAAVAELPPSHQYPPLPMSWEQALAA